MSHETTDLESVGIPHEIYNPATTADTQNVPQILLSNATAVCVTPKHMQRVGDCRASYFASLMPSWPYAPA